MQRYMQRNCKTIALEKQVAKYKQRENGERGDDCRPFIHPHIFYRHIHASMLAPSMASAP